MEKKFFVKDIYFLLFGLVPKGIKEDHNKWSSFCFPNPNLFGEGIDIYLMATIRDSGLVLRTAEYSITGNFKLFHNRFRDFLMLMKTKRRGKYITMKHTM